MADARGGTVNLELYARFCFVVFISCCIKTTLPVSLPNDISIIKDRSDVTIK